MQTRKDVWRVGWRGPSAATGTLFFHVRARDFAGALPTARCWCGTAVTVTGAAVLGGGGGGGGYTDGDDREAFLVQRGVNSVPGTRHLRGGVSTPRAATAAPIDSSSPAWAAVLPLRASAGEEESWWESRPWPTGDGVLQQTKTAIEGEVEPRRRVPVRTVRTLLEHGGAKARKLWRVGGTVAPPKRRGGSDRTGVARRALGGGRRPPHPAPPVLPLLTRGVLLVVGGVGADGCLQNELAAAATVTSVAAAAAAAAAAALAAAAATAGQEVTAEAAAGRRATPHPLRHPLSSNVPPATTGGPPQRKRWSPPCRRMRQRRGGKGERPKRHRRRGSLVTDAWRHACGRPRARGGGGDPREAVKGGLAAAASAPCRPTPHGGAHPSSPRPPAKIHHLHRRRCGRHGCRCAAAEVVRCNTRRRRHKRPRWPNGRPRPPSPPPPPPQSATLPPPQGSFTSCATDRSDESARCDRLKELGGSTVRGSAPEAPASPSSPPWPVDVWGGWDEGGARAHAHLGARDASQEGR